jgi:hypothetical protein
VNRVEEIDARCAQLRKQIESLIEPSVGYARTVHVLAAADEIARLSVEREYWAKSPAAPAHNQGAGRKPCTK